MDVSFPYLARWTVWANTLLFDACATLEPDEYYLCRENAFKSIHLTLNHLLVMDIVWLSRLEGVTHDIPSMDYQLCPTFEALREKRAELDDLLIEVVTRASASRYGGETLSYLSMDGRPSSLPVNVVLTHLFLHHSHHRGQIHCMLSQTPIHPPSMDITYFANAVSK